MTIESRVDAAQPVTVNAVRYADVSVAGDGQHTVVATATDRAGNISAPASLAVRIDATSPTSTAAVDSAARSVTVIANDATSGVARIEYAIDAGAWTEYTGPIQAPNSSKHIVSFRALDKAGNLEVAKTITIPADLSGPLTGNIGPIATPTASYTAGWNAVTALNDGADPSNPSQAQIWGTWSGDRPATQWVQYDWTRAVRVTGAELKFWRDSDRGTGDGVAEPDSWSLQYWDDASSTWRDVTGVAGYGTSSTAFNTVTFDPVTTPRLRSTIGANGDGSSYSAVAITEWRVFADDPGTGSGDPLPVTVTVEPRCVAGKAYLAVQARNGHDSPVDISIETPYGARSYSDVAPGANAYQSFATRTASAAAGSVTVRATGVAHGREVTTVLKAEHGGVQCAG
jgi:hypothetical protein